MKHFGLSHGYIVTCDEKGTIPLNARIAAKVDEHSNADAISSLVAQANAAVRLVAALDHLMAFWANNSPVHPGAEVVEEARLALAHAKEC